MKTERSVQRSTRLLRGSAVVELGLLAPWIFLLFMGILDFGFYSYAAISVENAARVAALYTSTAGPGATADSTGACFYVLRELRMLPNVGPALTTCTAAPVQVSAQVATVGGVPATQVSITYQGITLFPIPFLTDNYSVTRTVWMNQ